MMMPNSILRRFKDLSVLHDVCISRLALGFVGEARLHATLAFWGQPTRSRFSSCVPDRAKHLLVLYERLLIILLVICYRRVRVGAHIFDRSRSSDPRSSVCHLRHLSRRYFQHAHFIPIVVVGKRGE